MIGTPSVRPSVTSLPSAPAPGGSSSESSTFTVASFCMRASISRPRRPRSRRDASPESAKHCSSARPKRGTKADAPTKRAAHEIAGRRRADTRRHERRRLDGDVRRAEPAEDRARGREKKDDEDTVAEGGDLRDVEQGGAENAAKDETDEC